jgi:hypothetical protein
MNDAMKEHATVVSVYGEVVSLFQVLQALELPMSILGNEAIFRYRPPATLLGLAQTMNL